MGKANVQHIYYLVSGGLRPSIVHPRLVAHFHFVGPSGRGVCRESPCLQVRMGRRRRGRAFVENAPGARYRGHLVLPIGPGVLHGRRASTRMDKVRGRQPAALMVALRDGGVILRGVLLSFWAVKRGTSHRVCST